MFTSKPAIGGRGRRAGAFGRWIKCAAAAAAALLLALPPAGAAEEVNLYTDRQEVFLKPVLRAFEADTGIKVNVLFAKKGLLERMRAEGDHSPADVLLAVDIGRLQDFIDAGVLAPYNDPAIAAAVLPGYSTDYWVAVTRRARILYVPRGSAIKDYDDLAQPAQRGKVCLRSGRNTYNIGLFADMIARHGEAAAKQWLAGVKANLARKPQGKDRTQIQDVAAGVCGVGVANSYYYFQLIKDPEQRKKLENVQPLIPPRAHINVTGAALAAHAPHRANALRLMRFLVSRPAQEIYASENNEFPVRADAELPPALAPYKRRLDEAADLADIARYRAAASRLVEALDFDR